MDYGNSGLSASDVALIQDRNNNGFGGFVVDNIISNFCNGRLE